MSELSEKLISGKSKSFLAAIIESTDDAIIGKSLEGEILSWNQAAEKLYGYTQEEVLGKCIAIIIPKDRQAEKDIFLDKIVLGEKIDHYETVRIRKDGTPVSVSLTISPILDENGEILGASTIARDIHANKESEKKLENLLGFQESILREAVTSIIATDAKGTITLFNRAAEELLGYTAEEVIGKHTPALFHDKDEVVSRARELSEQFNTTLEPGFDVFVYPAQSGQPESREWTYIRKDQSRFPVWLSVSALKNSDGEIFGYLGVGSDLTQRKEEEETNKRINQQLQQINRIQQEFYKASERKRMFDDLLETFISNTQSEYGFIGEILYTDQKDPYLRTHSITNIAWSEETRAMYEKNLPNGLEFFNLDTLFGKVIRTGQPLITNEPQNHPEAGGLPEGHPDLNAFLGVPLFVEGEMIGMVGLANRPAGYAEKDLEFLRPLLLAVSNLIQAQRSEQKRLKIEEEVRENELRLRAVLNNTIDGIITIEKHGIVQDFNPAAERIFGYAADEVIGNNVKMLMPDSYAVEHDTYIQNYLKTGKAKIIGIGRQVVGKRKDGQTFPLELGISSMDMGNEKLFVGITRDISEQKMAEKAREQLASIVENTEDAIWALDLDGTITLWNKAAKKIFGYSEIEIVGQEINLLVPDDRQSEPGYILEKIKRGETLNSFQTQRKNNDGQFIHVSLTVSPIYGENGLIVGASTIARDISSQVVIMAQKEELIKKLEEINLRDPLTNLLNRRGMMQRLEYERSRYRRFGGVFSLLMIDIDHFKKINDTYGHQTGDEALLFVTKILTDNCREQDSVGRWGGEEFLILLPQTDNSGAIQFANKLITSIREQSFEFEGNTISLTASMGLTTIHNDEDSLEALLSEADELLYLAKENGRDRVISEKPRNP